ncbi:MAG: KH domain-containing protein [Erysipelotrichaceae bacterium]|jgi:predicted RNA-binding protein YlqC (UPF0109 family)|nr:KH domain-containing protein [Erysipelotrichaceae bacterium]
MTDLEQTLYDLAAPLVEDKDSLAVKTMSSLDSREIVLYVYASKEDISRLIGRQGGMANSLRQMMNVASRIKNKRLSIKFESY